MKTNVMEYIEKERKLQGIKATEYAARLPFSRQRIESLIAAGDAPFKHVRLMLNALGKDIVILTREGTIPSFANTAEKREKIYTTFNDSKIRFSKLDEIINLTLGYKFGIGDMQTADSASDEKGEHYLQL